MAWWKKNPGQVSESEDLGFILSLPLTAVWEPLTSSERWVPHLTVELIMLISACSCVD